MGMGMVEEKVEGLLRDLGIGGGKEEGEEEEGEWNKEWEVWTRGEGEHGGEGRGESRVVQIG